MHIAAYKIWLEITIPGIEKLRNTWLQKATIHESSEDRAHSFHGCNTLTVGQEFSGYVSQLDHGLKAIKNTLPHCRNWHWVEPQFGTGINTPPVMRKM